MFKIRDKEKLEQQKQQVQDITKNLDFQATKD